MVGRILGLVALLAVVYIGLSYGRPHFRAWRFRDAMTQEARLSTIAESADVKRDLLEVAEDLEVPLEPRRLTVREATRGGIEIAASWEEIVTLSGGPLGPWVDTLNFDFEAVSTRRDDR